MVAKRYPRLRSDCTYRTNVARSRVGRRTVRVTARLIGNRVVEPISARPATVRTG